MDLNYLYYRHQVSLFLADHSPSEPARRAHGEMAAGYASRIAEAKNPLPVAGQA